MKPRVGRLTDSASQVPLVLHVFVFYVDGILQYERKQVKNTNTSVEHCAGLRPGLVGSCTWSVLVSRMALSEIRISLVPGLQGV